MKLSNTAITVIIAVAVVIAGLVVGFSVRHARSRNAGIQPQTAADAPQLVGSRPGPGYGSQKAFPSLSPAERARIKQQRQKMLERMANMTDEEKKTFRAQIRDRFNDSRIADRERLRRLSKQERAILIKQRQQWENMRAEWESMSGQQRQEFLNKMREMFDAERRPNEVNEVK